MLGFSKDGVSVFKDTFSGKGVGVVPPSSLAKELLSAEQLCSSSLSSLNAVSASVTMSFVQGGWSGVRQAADTALLRYSELYDDKTRVSLGMAALGAELRNSLESGSPVGDEKFFSDRLHMLSLSAKKNAVSGDALSRRQVSELGELSAMFSLLSGVGNPMEGIHDMKTWSGERTVWSSGTGAMESEIEGLLSRQENKDLPKIRLNEKRDAAPKEDFRP